MRPYWKGYLKLALVSCPIALHASVSTIHAPFPTEVERKMHGHSPENFESHDPP